VTAERAHQIRSKLVELPCKAAEKAAWQGLQGKAAGQSCRARLPGKAAGQGCRARLPGKAAGQGYMNAMAKYAEQLKHGEIGRKCSILTNVSPRPRTTKPIVDPRCTYYIRSNAGKNAYVVLIQICTALAQASDHCASDHLQRWHTHLWKATIML
jgi:hypothetical protein